MMRVKNLGEDEYHKLLYLEGLLEVKGMLQKAFLFPLNAHVYWHGMP